MKHRIESATAALAVCALLGAGPVGGAQPSNSSNTADANRQKLDATGEAIVSLLDEVWGADDHEAPRLVATTLRNARRGRAEMADVQYAYGLVLMHHGAWREAADVLERVIKGKPKFASGYVALAECHLRSSKLNLSMAVLTDAVAQIPTDPLTIDAVASLVTFLTKRPLPGIKSDRLTELRDSLLGRLDADGQATYQAAAERIDRYIEDLPQRRAQRLESLATKHRQRTEIVSKVSEVEFDYAKLDFVSRFRSGALDKLTKSERKAMPKDLVDALTPAERQCFY